MCVCYVQQFLGTIGVIVCAVAAGIIEVSLGALDRHTAARGKNYSVSKGYVQQFLGTIGVIVCAVAAGIIEVSLGALDRHMAARGKNYSVSKAPADPQSILTRRSTYESIKKF